MNTKKAESGQTRPGGLSRAAQVFELEVEQAFERLPLSSASGLVVAFSGGVDSHVLLKCVSNWHTARFQNQPAAMPALTLRAHHINHGLQTASADWTKHCETVCQQLQVDFSTSRVSVELDAGLSPEDAARQARYSAFESILRKGEILLVAHHADDQAETLLLQLFRGAGVNGLAAMPELVCFACGYLARPMLQCGGDQVRVYAKASRLQWIEDPSNRDNGFDRNLLRNQVMPLLKARWPSVAASISRSASHCSEAAATNRLYAKAILAEQIERRELPVAMLADRSVTDKKLLLRCWIEYHDKQMPSTSRLNQLMRDLVDAGDDSAGDMSWGDVRLRRYRDRLYLGTRGELANGKPFRYHWASIQQPLIIEETGQVLTQQDIPPEHSGSSLSICSRQGGELLKLAGHRHHKAVKKLFQECAIPPWRRDRLPFVFAGETLIGIVGIGFID